jgi:hypothetical protein
MVGAIHGLPLPFIFDLDLVLVRYAIAVTHPTIGTHYSINAD